VGAAMLAGLRMEIEGVVVGWEGGGRGREAGF
jgi:hypothetical protein